jgi:hypothetical protein
VGFTSVITSLYLLKASRLVFSSLLVQNLGGYHPESCNDLEPKGTTACGRKGRDHGGPGPRNVEERERERDGSQQRPRGSDERGAVLRKHSDTWDRRTPGDRTKTGRREIVDTEIRQDSDYTRKQVITNDGLHGGYEMGTCREHTGVPRNKCNLSSPRTGKRGEAVAVIQQRSVLVKPKRPPLTFSKPLAFIAEPGGRYNHPPSDAFHIADLAFINPPTLSLIAFISVDLSRPRFLPVNRPILTARIPFR